MSSRACFASLTVVLCFAMVHVSAQTMATANGRIIVGNPVDLPTLEVPAGLHVDIYDLLEEPLDWVPDPPPSNDATIFWGYEAGFFASRILTYDANNKVKPHTGPDCVPEPLGNGRGLAKDPLDNNLWYTFLIGFSGEGHIYKAAPPTGGGGVPGVTPPCALVNVIPFGDGPGGTIQDDIGAIDIDQGSKHLWVAGYLPVTVNSVARSYFYLVNRNNGKIINYCWMPFRGGGIGIGNDTLAYARLSGLPGSGQYLLTDAGGDVTVPNTLAAIDSTECKGGKQVIPKKEFDKRVPMTGIEFEWLGLIASDAGDVLAELPISNLWKLGGPPFQSPELIGLAEAGTMDLAFCGFRAKLGGGGNDFCTVTGCSGQ